MNPNFWKERWQLNEIGFHQPHINAYLKEYWSKLGVQNQSKVLVPLCGKSLDMLWLLAQGYQVLGVELSHIAITDFFREQQLVPKISKQGSFQLLKHADLSILQGDFFQLNEQDLQGVTAVYDRAALVALPYEMRKAYVNLLRRFLPEEAAILLIVFEYVQNKMEGPPFSVNEDEVRQLYHEQYRIELLSQQSVLHEYPPFQQRGLTSLHEKVYLLKPR
jgi:thiopurine S-methyltransferase